jgi:phosphoribosylamine--glycine ligase
MADNVLVIGAGAREHALAWKLRESPQVGEVFVAPGNPGTAEVAVNLALDPDDAEAVLDALDRHAIGLTVIGPEAPLVAGLADALRARGGLVFGPGEAGARIEGSKSWAKAIMEEWGVPTARAEVCRDPAAADAAIATMSPPVVVKADGLAAGKGVLICDSHAEARAAVRTLLVDGALGAAGRTVLVEEYLTGLEISLLAVTDGETTLPLLPACDYKRIHDGDQGPNTGGMGAYAPPAIANDALISEVMRSVIQPTLDGMRPYGIDYRGVLYAGLMLTPSGLKVLEFNCRFGDPEAQVVLPMLDGDFYALCRHAARGTLQDAAPPRWRAGACVGVVLASGGYPDAYAVGYPISGLDDLPHGGLVFQAGTAWDSGATVTAGGRVLTAVGRGGDMAEARALAYETAEALSFSGSFFRRDIAARELVAQP